MLNLETDIEGKQMRFGHAKRSLKKHGFVLGGGWEYDAGIFDGIMHRDGGETIYVRIPFRVLQGELDKSNAFIEFETPYVIKHVVHVGLERDENSLLSTTGFNQFQKPLDKDGYIHDKSKWQEFGEETIGDILNKLH
ncbi:MAG TPA: YugN family protein [Virgibacillus sp.]|nr:YugN family protein [Virgibacillus sp.]